jgi:hypothetical protein
LFNRAYKLYTSKHISKRSNGAGVSTDSEYTSFGENGPYRNNKIFDAWENAVLDIMKDRKYQFIFDKKTKLRVGDELRPNGGANLRKFMTDMMDGENLYKSKSGYSEGGQGTQAKLLDRYFGEADEKSKAELDKTGGAFDEGEGAANAKKAAEIKKAAVVIKPTKWENAVRDNDPGQRANVAIPESFFVIKGKMDGQEIKRAFFIQKIEGGFTYMQYSKSFGAFKGYLGRIDGAKTFEDGDLNISTEKKDVYYTKIKTNDFDKIFLSPGTISVGRMTPGKEDVNVDKIELIATYWITKEKDDKDVVYGAIQKGAQIGTDDRKRKQLEDALGDTKSIVSKIVSKNDVITEKK